MGMAAGGRAFLGAAAVGARWARSPQLAIPLWDLSALGTPARPIPALRGQGAQCALKLQSSAPDFLRALRSLRA